MFFTTIDQIKEFLGLSVSVKLDVLKPILETVDRNYIKPVIGPAMFSELQEYFDADMPRESEAQEAMYQLLKLAQACEINLAYWTGFDVLNTTIMADGFKRTETSTIKGLFKYQEDNLKDYFKTSGFNLCDSMLELMDGELRSNFAEFHSSDIAKANASMFIPSTAIFNSLYFIGSSRLIFTRLIPYMRVIEDLKLKQLIGKSIYDYMKIELAKVSDPEIENSGPSAKALALLPYIRLPLVYFSTAMLMQETGAELSDKGLFFESITSNLQDHSNKTPALQERIISMIKRNNELGESYFALLRNYLFENTTNWDNFTAPLTGRFSRDNTDKRTFFA